MNKNTNYISNTFTLFTLQSRRWAVAVRSIVAARCSSFSKAKSFRMAGMACALLILFSSGCKTLDINVSISPEKAPASFGIVSDTGNVAEIVWREYFSDSLLAGLIDTALHNNFDLLIALQKIEAARAGVKFAKGSMAPQVTVEAAGSMRKFGFYTMDGAGNATTDITPGQLVPEHLPDMFTGIGTSWEVDIWGKLRNEKRAAASRFLASMEGARFVTTNLIAEVASLYYELLALDNELEILRETINAQRDALEKVRVQKDAGAANELAVQQFEAQLLQMQAQEKETLQRIVEAENALNFLLGRYPQPVARNSETLSGEIPPAIRAGIPSDLLTNRPDIREAEKLVAATNYDVKAARAAFFPSFNIVGMLGFQAFNPEFLFQSPASIAYGVFGSLATPLINRSALKANFRTAKAAQLEAMYVYQQSVLNGYVEVANEISGIGNLQQIRDFKERQSETLRQAVGTSIELFRAGRANYLDVLLARQNALQAQLELTDIKRQQFNKLVSLYKALGGGWK